MDELELKEIVSKLRPMIENGDCIVWVGSGLSKSADYPDWKETVKKLCDKCDVTVLSESEEESPDKLIDKAEQCKKKDIDVYHNTLAKLFGGRPVNTRFAYQDLMKLPFKAYLTTNFDPLLSETGIREEYDKLYYYPEFPSELGNYHPIVYLHGHARPDNHATGENLILARSDFNEAYEAVGTAKYFLIYLFTHYSFLFLGCSLTEPVIYKVFQIVHKINELIKKTHPDKHFPQRYIILPTRKVSEISSEEREQVSKMEIEENNRFAKMNIEVLSYEPDDVNRHGEIEEILDQLCKYIKRPKNVFENEEMP